MKGLRARKDGQYIVVFSEWNDLSRKVSWTITVEQAKELHEDLSRILNTEEQ